MNYPCGQPNDAVIRGARGRYRSQSIGSGDNNKTIGPTLGGGAC